MSVRILIMGLPGAGKTTLASEISTQLKAQGKDVEWFNADRVREEYNDWDFSPEGRVRQSVRMRALADKSAADVVICDFVAALTEMRDIFEANWTVWVDTIQYGRFEDTNKAFVPPTAYNFRVTEQDAKKWATVIIEQIQG